MCVCVCVCVYWYVFGCLFDYWATLRELPIYIDIKYICTYICAHARVCVCVCMCPSMYAIDV